MSNPIENNAKLPHPDFFVLSPPRSGSTWLFQNLRYHPGIFIPPAKELRYFSNLLDICYPEWYQEQFNDGIGKIKGDVSPTYAVLCEDSIRAAQEMAPDLRFLMLLRDPIERAWSHVCHQLRCKEAVFNLLDSYEKKAQLVKSMECATGALTLAYSDYVGILKRWMKFFPRERFYVNFLGNLPPRVVLQEMFDHVGAAGDVDWSAFPIDTRFNFVEEVVMPSEIRQRLTAQFAPRMRELGEFLSGEFGLSLPDSWTQAIGTDLTDTETAGQIIFQSRDDQSLLRDIALQQSILLFHTQELRSNYHGYQIVAYRGECVAISLSELPGFTPSVASRDTMEKHKQDGLIIVRSTLKALEQEIDHRARISEHNPVTNKLQRDIATLCTHLEQRDHVLSLMRSDMAAISTRIEAIDEMLAARQRTFLKRVWRRVRKVFSV